MSLLSPPRFTTSTYQKTTGHPSRSQRKTVMSRCGQTSIPVCIFVNYVAMYFTVQMICYHLIQHHRTILMSVEEGTAATRPRKQQLFPPGCSPYHCSMCSRDFNRLENLKTHLRIHTGERPYSCSLCGVRFRHSGALTRHFRIHTGEKPYVCDECGKSFRNCGGLRYHQKSHHPSTVFETSRV